MIRRTLFASLAVLAWLAASAPAAHAQFTVTVTVDENGNGTLKNSAGFNSALPFALLQDPGPGGLAGALTYNLLNPPGMVAGDLVLLEPGTQGEVTDVVRFNPQQNGGSLVFYSDFLDDGKDSLADIGFPAQSYANSFAVFETGAEGNNGFNYTPTAGMPGFVAGAGGPVTYVIMSDTPTVPEPGPIALGCVAALAGGALAWRRRRIAS
jgi:hypothetical protein